MNMELVARVQEHLVMLNSHRDMTPQEIRAVADIRSLCAEYLAISTDTVRLDWIEDKGLMICYTNSEMQDGSEIGFWMVGPDNDASNAIGFGKTARNAIDNAMNASLVQEI